MVTMIIPLLILSFVFSKGSPKRLDIVSANPPRADVRCQTSRGQFPHPVFCDWFYNCWDGAVYEQRCPQQLAFNPSIRSCDYPANVDCGTQILSWYRARDSRCPTPSGVYADPSRGCSAFVVCERGLPVEFACPDHLYFDPATNVCDYAYKLRSVCRDDPNPGDDFRCPRADGVFAFDDDDDDCDSRFWVCEGYRAMAVTCDDGTVYDASQGQCVDPRYGLCRYDYELPVNAVLASNEAVGAANSTKEEPRLEDQSESTS